MRIVFVTPSLPLSRRSYGFLEHLCARHDVTVVAAFRSASELAAAGRLRTLGAEVVTVSEERGSALERALNVSARDPWTTPRRLSAAVATEVARRDVGIVHLTGVPSPDLLDLGVPLVWDADVAPSPRANTRAELLSSPAARARATRAAARIAERECALVQALPAITVSTAREREALLKSLGDEPPNHSERDTHSQVRQPHISVVPHGVEVEPQQEHRRRHHNRLVVSLDGGAPEDRLAVHWLAEDLMPRLWYERPDVRLTLLSARAPRGLGSFLLDPRVCVVPGAEDARPYIAGATVALSPLLDAAGLRDDVLTALASGTPLVATTAAAEGLAAVAGRDLLMADDTDDIARRVLDLFEDELLRRTLARNGRAYVERAHSWRLATHQLEQVYTEVSGFDYVQLAPALPMRSLRYLHA